MASTCFEPEGSSSGRRVYVQVWYSVLYMHQYRAHTTTYKTAYADTCKTIIRLMECYTMLTNK
jgi:hypothetical protein